MKFSTRTTYGLRAMIRLAKGGPERFLSLAAIAREEKISLGYLEKLFVSLKKHKLVKAGKGTAGGYALATRPDKITVFTIIKALEGKMTLFSCLDEGGRIYCHDRCGCGALVVLRKVQGAVNRTLKGITLKDLV